MVESSAIEFHGRRSAIVLLTWLAFGMGSPNGCVAENPTLTHPSWCHRTPLHHQQFDASVMACSKLRGGAPWRVAPPVADRFDAKTKPAEVTVAAKEQMNAFLTRDSRNHFIARVYAILAAQLVVTAGTVFLFGTQPALAAWMHQGLGALVPLISLLLSTAAWVFMSISPHARRSAPMKWQMLALFTLGEALSVGFVSSFYEMRSVVTTMVVTALTTSSLSLYIMRQRHVDTTQWGATLSSMGLIFVFYGLIQILQYAGIIPSGLIPYNEMMYGIVGATLFSAYLAYHTKVITAGNNSKYQMNEKDYVFGAMTLYNDIINFFVYLLKALGEERDE